MAAEGILRAAQHLGVLLLQWGRGRMAAEGAMPNSTFSSAVSFNGAAAGWPRKVDPVAGRTAKNHGFNGAAAGWPRKALNLMTLAGPTFSFNGAAAGWPRKATGSVGRPARAAGFNGAAAGWPRKAVEIWPTLFLMFVLQWGRGRMAAEGGIKPRAHGKELQASMGPRPDGRGRPGSRRITVARTSSFNGAAAGWPRKAFANGRRRRRGRSFNGAAAGWPRKADFSGNGQRACLMLQWGRGRMAAEGYKERGEEKLDWGFNGAAAGWPRKDGRRHVLRDLKPSFNGAAAGWPRKGAVEVVRLALGGLQWGRGRMAAEGLIAADRRRRLHRLQWGRGRMAAEGSICSVVMPPPPPRFNGAAAGWPRKEELKSS